MSLEEQGIVDDCSSSAIATALSENFECIYYVSLVSGIYREYNDSRFHDAVGMPSSGSDFFGNARKVLARLARPSDLYGALDFFCRDNMMSVLEKSRSMSKVFRITLDGVTVCLRATASKARQNRNHVVIAIENLDRALGDNLAQEEYRLRNINSIMQLSSDLIAVFDVCRNSGKYEVFVHRSNAAVPFAEGHYVKNSFYSDMSGHCLQNACENDKKSLCNFYSSEFLSEMLGQGKECSLEYRFMSNGRPHWFRTKVVPNYINDKMRMIVGIYDINEQLERDIQQKAKMNELMEQSSKDALTGVKNKNAYILQESIINHQMTAGSIGELSIVVCDVNELKNTNDTCGHEIGDEILKDACEMICSTFKRSPVYRIGGDEFAVIVSKNDMPRRFELLEKLQKRSAVNAEYNGVVVASGMADYCDGDACVADVFSRADRSMYENKANLKAMKFDR